VEVIAIEFLRGTLEIADGDVVSLNLG